MESPIMVNMEKINFDAFKAEDMTKFAELTSNNAFAVFIYNKNYYFNGKNSQIDNSNYKVRTEFRKGVPVSPIEVFGLLSDLEISDNTIKFGNNSLFFEIGSKNYTVGGTSGMFTVEPFILHGHVYVPVIEFAIALGLSAGSYYKNRLTVIGNAETIEKLKFGDADLSGEINALDLTHIKRALLTNETDYEINPTCDTNGDGKINLIDLIRLKRYLANEDVSLGISA